MPHKCAAPEYPASEQIAQPSRAGQLIMFAAIERSPVESDARAPAGNVASRAGAACSLFTSAVAQHINYLAYVARIALADFIQRQQ